MFSSLDLAVIKEKGISPQEVENQLNYFKKGFPELAITKAATSTSGIRCYKEAKRQKMVDIYESKGKNLKKVKFVPASGAATRMFKSLFEILNNYGETEEEYLKIMSNRSFESFYYVCQNLINFALYNDLKKVMLDNNTNINEVSKKKDIIGLLKYLLTNKGLDYGNKPKGLLKFHKSDKGDKTPVEEHLIEGAMYAVQKNKVRLHFTVSESHLNMFKEHINTVIKQYEKEFNLKYTVDFSVQKPSTDTIAVDIDNQPFRDNEGKLVFRPGGHGALLQNLNEIDADIVFIKNIDNVVQEHLQKDTIYYKKVLAGLLIETQSEIFDWVKKLSKHNPAKFIEPACHFATRGLSMQLPVDFDTYTVKEKAAFLLSKLNRPLRVCGMVRNEGEPGGGPFWVENTDKSVSLQIVESSQISADKKGLMEKATHFNPVDIVCSFKNHKGKKYNLNDFVDKNTGFISSKSFEGRELKALELPGLWNGAMANWNTIFVEVPVTTFSPVKTIFDLLKSEHLYKKDLLLTSSEQYYID